MQISTTISDGALVLACSVAACLAFAPHPSGAAGFALVGLAAFAGVLRFSVMPQIAPLHVFLSAFAAQVGVPLVGFALVQKAASVGQAALAPIVVGVALTLLFLLFHLWIKLPAYALGVGALGMLAATAAGARLVAGGDWTAGMQAILGALAVAFAGLAIGDQGQLGAFRRIDLFHYVLATAMLLMGSALRT